MFLLKIVCNNLIHISTTPPPPRPTILLSCQCTPLGNLLELFIGVPLWVTVSREFANAISSVRVVLWNYFNIILVSLVWLETCKLYTEKASMCKWEGYPKFNISKDGNSKYCEVELFLQW